MTQQEFCRNCNQRHNCREVYQQLGDVKGPSVVCKVLVAFLLPIVVFIAVLAVSETILAKVITRRDLQTAVNLLLALSVTAVYILVIKIIRTRPGKSR